MAEETALQYYKHNECLRFGVAELDRALDLRPNSALYIQVCFAWLK